MNSNKLDLSGNGLVTKLWSQYYEKLRAKIIETPVNLYCDEFYNEGNIWGLLANDEIEGETLQKYVGEVYDPKYVYRVLGDVVGCNDDGNGNYNYVNISMIKHQVYSQEHRLSCKESTT